MEWRYGGGRREKGMEKLEERYLRWVLGVDRGTPGYLVREELQREKLRGRTGRRAWRFEKRLEEGKGNVLARRCWEKMREELWTGKGESEWKRRGGRSLKIEGWK